MTYHNFLHHREGSPGRLYAHARPPARRQRWELVGVHAGHVVQEGGGGGARAWVEAASDVTRALDWINAVMAGRGAAQQTSFPRTCLDEEMRCPLEVKVPKSFREWHWIEVDVCLPRQFANDSSGANKGLCAGVVSLSKRCLNEISRSKRLSVSKADTSKGSYVIYALFVSCAFFKASMF